MKIELIKTYKYSPDGNLVITLNPGEHDLSERWATKAIAGGFAKKEKAHKRAPMNKSK
jgi:hypothetical protein